MRRKKTFASSQWVGKGHPPHFMRGSTWEFGQTPPSDKSKDATKRQIKRRHQVTNQNTPPSDKSKDATVTNQKTSQGQIKETS